MGIEEVNNIIQRIADGFVDACVQVVAGNTDTALKAIGEQLYSGLDGESNYLSPTYDDDPYFLEDGPWKDCAKEYKLWKQDITPPESSSLLGLPARPDNVPNLFINGKFFSEITATMSDTSLITEPGNGNGPDIVNKYGSQILILGPTATSYFQEEILMPAIGDFFEACGYR